MAGIPYFCSERPITSDSRRRACTSIRHGMRGVDILWPSRTRGAASHRMEYSSLIVTRRRTAPIRSPGRPVSKDRRERLARSASLMQARTSFWRRRSDRRVLHVRRLAARAAISSMAGLIEAARCSSPLSSPGRCKLLRFPRRCGGETPSRPIGSACLLLICELLTNGRLAIGSRPENYPNSSPPGSPATARMSIGIR